MNTSVPRTTANFWLWYILYFIPRKISSCFANRIPVVQNSISAPASQLFGRIFNVNVSAPTKMCAVMTKHGSDKGRRWHNYTTIYSSLFREYRDRPLRIFELGLGTNNPNLMSSMGSTGRPGASLRGWREIFPRASVFGADIDRAILFQEDRIKTFHCDQLDQNSIRALWSQPELREGFDILIEDGLHTFEANVSFLDGSIEHVRAGGIYVVEDIARETIQQWQQKLSADYTKRYPDCEFALLTLPNPMNSQDNNLLVIHRTQQPAQTTRETLVGLPNRSM